MRFITHYSCRGRWEISLFAGLILFLASSGGAAAMTDLYELSKSTGSPTDMSGSTTLFRAYESNRSSGLRDIGFDFYFDQQKYTKFNVTPSGLLSFASSPYTTYYPYYFPNSSNLRNSYPLIAGYWGRYFYPSGSGKVHYKVTGTAPNRVLTVEWLNVGRFGSTSNHWGTYQVRLYETSNKIEFFYDHLQRYSSSSTSYSGAIGMASSATRYLNVYGNNFPSEVYLYPNGGYTTYYRVYYDPIDDNTLYTFSPCERELVVTGDVTEGGTEKMEKNDVLLSDKAVQRGSSNSFRPFLLTNPDNGCTSVSYTASFSGPAAADYSVASGTIGIGGSASPEIVFTPQAIGERNATVTFNLSNGTKLTYGVNASGLTRINWLADISEGGVEGMPNGVELMKNIDVNRGASGDFQPFTIENFNLNPGSDQAEVRYILDDPLDEYEITLPGEEGLTDYIGGGESSTPVLTFSPHNGGTDYGTGHQQARLTVIADGEMREYVLQGFSVAPAVEFFLEDEPVLGGDGRYFRNIVTCVGEQATTMRMTIRNVNKVDVELENFDVYLVDSRVQEGAPPYPLLENSWGGLVKAQDYVLSEDVGVAPTTANRLVKFPLTLSPGEERTYYLTYVSQMPEKRYARLFMQTNGVNFFGRSLESTRKGSTVTEEREGLLTLEFFGRGVGGGLSKDMSGALEGLSMTFAGVKVGESVESEAMVYNTGECELRISKSKLLVSTGDASEFELLEVFPGVVVDGDDYVIGPGQSGKVTARFTPNRSGSRRASLMLQTNDSTVQVEGITERGVYYLNLYGVGKADLRARSVELPPAVIGGAGSAGVVRVENTSTEVLEITGLNLVGADVGELSEDAANPWPALPIRLDPETSVDLGVALNVAAGGVPGVREAVLEISYGSGGTEQIKAKVSGLAGTRELQVGPQQLFAGMEVPVGSIARRTAILSNTGTFPVTLTNLRIEGPGMADYSFIAPHRGTIDPGSFAFVEVSFTPGMIGNSDAKLVISSDAVNGDLEVTLNGTASSTAFTGDPSNGSGETVLENDTEQRAARPSHGATLSLGQNMPNPAGSSAEITFALPATGSVEMELYDAAGSLVRTILSEDRAAGEHSVRVDTRGLPNGLYFYTLRQNGQVLTRSMTIVK